MPEAVELAGCLAVTGPTSRFNGTVVAKMQRFLLQEAAELSYYLGGRYALLESAAQQANREVAM